MAKLRLKITKGKEIGYISHLDYARTVERSIRRSYLPAAYSEGFNPHMKIAFASALSVGVTSEAEYLDIELTSEVEMQTAVDRLAAQLPVGINIKGYTYVAPQTLALMAIVNLATYKIMVPLLAADSSVLGIEHGVNEFNEASQVFYIKESPKKGKKEIDVKQYVDNVASNIQEKYVELIFAVKITPTGSIKPIEVLDALVTLYDLPVEMASALIQRTGLYIVKDDSKKTPLDI